PVLSETAATAAAPASEGTGRLVEEITQALRQVIDPELGYNIVDLGLIYHVDVDTDGLATVTMTTTSPGCPATGYLSDGARERAESVEAITRAEVKLTYEPRWSTELMSDGAKAHLGIGTGGRR
ncbi:MAG: metal-sulfur cluster assembly factor, partial [Nitratireductor sp.]